MEIKIDQTWMKVLSDEFVIAYFVNLICFVTSEYNDATCYPPKSEIFAAFNECPFNKIKIVIIGQDPYHRPHQANGLCFSVHDGITFPPSLVNIFKEIANDIKAPNPTTGNLQRWARQGVLLLNATLTVRQGQPGSHQKKGWEVFTDCVIEKISNENDNVVFMLWGGYAKKKGAKINRDKHLVLESGHPSPLSANKGHWFGNKHFSLANGYLKSMNKREIDW